MLAFHGKTKIKKEYLARVKAHRLADEIQKGYYWEKGKGCAVGCTVHSGDHLAYEKELGIPVILARLEDRIFESMQNGQSKEWPEQFLAAPKVGADLSMVWPRFALWLLTETAVAKAAEKREDVNAAVADVAKLYAKWVKSGIKPDRAQFEKAHSAAAAAAVAARWSVAAAYAVEAAAYAAEAAAEAHWSVAAAAAAVAAAVAAYEDARSQTRAAFWISARDKLLELMRAAPVVKAK